MAKKTTKNDPKKVAEYFCRCAKQWNNKKVILTFCDHTKAISALNGSSRSFGAKVLSCESLDQAKQIFLAISALKSNYGITAITLRRGFIY